MNDSLPDANLHQTDTGVTTQPILPSTARDVSGTGTRPPEPPPLHTPPLAPLPLSPHPPRPHPLPARRFQVGAAAGVSPSTGGFSETSARARSCCREAERRWRGSRGRRARRRRRDAADPLGTGDTAPATPAIPPPPRHVLSAHHRGRLARPPGLGGWRGREILRAPRENSPEIMKLKAGEEFFPPPPLLPPQPPPHSCLMASFL